MSFVSPSHIFVVVFVVLVWLEQHHHSFTQLSHITQMCSSTELFSFSLGGWMVKAMAASTPVRHCQFVTHIGYKKSDVRDQTGTRMCCAGGETTARSRRWETNFHSIKCVTSQGPSSAWQQFSVRRLCESLLCLISYGFYWIPCHCQFISTVVTF